MNNTQDSEQPTIPPLPPARGSASGPTWEQIIIQQVLAHLDALPEDWDNYSGHWKCGYNQCRNKVAALLNAKTPNKQITD